MKRFEKKTNQFISDENVRAVNEERALKRVEDFFPVKRNYIQGTEEDLYLVSYPRSGVTWLRVMLSELAYQSSGESLADLDYFVPDLSLNVLSDQIIPSSRHIFKSHESYLWNHWKTEKYKKVVYLMRDPRDVALSYYRYNQKLCNYAGSLDEFIADWIAGRISPGTWSQHVDSWEASSIEKYGVQSCLIKYEDLTRQPLAELKKISEFFSITADLKALEKAVSNSSVERMRQKEAKGKRRVEIASGFEFIGKAESGQWKTALTRSQQETLENAFGKTMKRFGYL